MADGVLLPRSQGEPTAPQPGPPDDEYPTPPPVPYTGSSGGTPSSAPRDPGDGAYPSSTTPPKPVAVPFSLPFEGEVVQKADMYAEEVHLYGMNSMGDVPGVVGESATRGGCLAASLFIRPLRGMAGGGRNRTIHPGQVQVQVRHYRVRGDDGVVRTCELRGNLRGAPPEIGDRVRVDGKVTRAEGGLIRASVITNVHSNQSVQAKIPKEIQRAKRRAVAGLAYLALLFVFVFLLIASCT